MNQKESHGKSKNAVKGNIFLQFNDVFQVKVLLV
jgi:hypothetical protein